MSQGNDGYGQFFKQARKASGLSDSAERRPADSARAGARDSSSNKQKNVNRKFKVRPEGDDDLGVSLHFSKTFAESEQSSRFGVGRTDAPSTPEQRLRARAGEKMQLRKSNARRKKAAFPKGATAFLTLTILGAALGYFRPDVYESLAAHVDIGAFGQANASEDKDGKSEAKPADKKDGGAESHGKEALNEKKSEGKAESKNDKSLPGETAKLAANDKGESEKSAEGESGKKEERATNIHGWTPEELSFFNKLNDRKKELDQRESELNKLEEELQKQKLALDAKIKQLDQTRSEISTALKSRVASDGAKVDKLVDFYSTMKPQQAAKVIETLNEDLAVTVLDKMKKKNAAEVLNLMDAKKARRLSELLTGYERTPASGASADDVVAPASTGPGAAK